MSDVWRICVVESDVSLNQNLVNALRKDGYVVQGVMKGADAMRVLWSEEYDVVICDLNLPGAGGFELLRWLRAYRSNVRPIVLGDAGGTADSGQRLQALESGAISYIEKPVDLRLLKDELRRLLQQTGFTASLDSFDLLDVIQMITMSRKSITLLINTGLEERGTLRFHNGDLAWAEYGVLRGEEAFFALAAHKNGTVTQQVSTEQLVTNVTQPLSRLIFQALQYRTKYANTQQPVGGQVGQRQVGQGQVGQGQVGQGQAQSLRSDTPVPMGGDEIDDSPFVFTSEGIVSSDLSSIQQMPQATSAFSVPQGPYPPTTQKDLHARREAINTSQSSPFQGEMGIAEKDSSQKSSWLSDQPTSSQAPVRSSTPFKQVPVSPTSPSGEMRQVQQSAQVPLRTTDSLPGNQQSAPQMRAFAVETEERRSSSSQGTQRPSSAPLPRPTGQSGVFERVQGRQNPPDALRENKPTQLSASLPQTQRQITRENHAAVVSALQTLGYSLSGFIAAAVIDVDNHPLAQVVIDEQDISQVWQLLSLVQRAALNALQSDEWGAYEETIMTTASRHVLMRTIGSDKKAFLALITTRETNFSLSLEIIADVEGAIVAALS
jgi:DNA-binding response OmpR family regulator/predicted regulator of Ras-like GTPase activity (Roadblock/LC7/MglB family)